MTPERWQEVSQLYQSALAQPAAMRTAFLAGACRDDSALRREVESLLAQEQAGVLVDQPVGAAAPAVLGGAPGLAPGTVIGAYRVTGLLGAGGMGQVYRAQDTKLQRDVALKILPDAFVHDPDRLARFTREAQVLASLNHPHIGAIYGFEDSGPIHALVLELVEGPTLADRIAQGPVPIDEALAIARQIAEALEAAHEHGIVHRDLKPANIKVREDGTVKVLDFGLAKLTRGDDGSGALPLGTQSPTVLSPAMTTVGVILGTAAYMAPEQAKGKPADKRSDVWAFGSVLYEMLTGRRAFEGEDVSDTLAAVLRGEPSWAALPPTVSETLRTLLRNCLEKDRRKRIADISTALYVLNGPDVLRGPATPGTARRTGMIWAASAGIVVAAIAVAVAALYRPGTPGDTGVYRSSIIPPANLTGDPIGRLAISPDGRRLAFIAPGPNGPNMLWVRPLDGLSVQPLAGTEGAAFPFWSHDGRYLAFAVDGQLKKIDAGGGAATVLANARLGSRGAWNQEDVILFNRTPNGELFRVSAGGGTPAVVTTLDRSAVEGSHRHPFFLPDGRHFLFVAFRGGTSAVLYAGSLDGGERVRLLENVENAAYAQGFLLFIRDGTLLAQPFDAGRLTLTGEAQPIAERVLINPIFGGLFSVSQGGALVYQTSDRSARLGLVDRSGSIVRRLDDRDRAFGYSDIRFSPDGARAAFTYLTGDTDNPDLWTIDLARGAFTRLTSDPGSDQRPVWSPDGDKLLFSSNRSKGGLDLFQRSGNAAGADTLVLAARTVTGSDDLNGAVINPSSWSPDGRFLLFSIGGPPQSRDLWALPLEGERKPFPYLVTPFAEYEAEFSPDGKWVAFVSNESDRLEVYVDTFPMRTGKIPVSTNGGRYPRWRRDGRELFYENRDAREILSVSVARGSRGLEIGPAQRLFGYFNDGERKHWDVTPDGQMFLLELNNLEKAEGDATPITLVVNWTAGLRR